MAPRAALLVVLSTSVATVLGAAPAGAATTRPAVEALTAAPATLPSAGGTVRLTARVRAARACTFRGNGDVRSVGCAGGRASVVVSVGPNTRTSPETLRFSLVAIGAHGRRALRTASVVEAAAPAKLVVRSESLPSATVGQPYSASLAASGGTPAYAFVVTAGGLPAGLTLSPDGQIAGTPTAPGGSAFTVSVTDSGLPSAQTATRTLTLPVGGGTPISTLPQPTYYEDNWSGYSELGTFTGVTGTFTIPTIAASSNSTTVSEWVGIDGAEPSDTSVIQAGVDESWTPGASEPAINAWWETWPSPGASVPVPVDVGDRVTVTIGAVGNGNWRIQLSDLTNGYTYSTDQPYNGPASSAEWIVERPTDFATDALLDFPQYSPPVDFTNLYTAGAPTSLQPIAMVNDADSEVVSVPSGISGAGFSVTYGATPAAAP